MLESDEQLIKNNTKQDASNRDIIIREGKLSQHAKHLSRKKDPQKNPSKKKSSIKLPLNTS